MFGKHFHKSSELVQEKEATTEPKATEPEKQKSKGRSKVEREQEKQEAVRVTHYWFSFGGLKMQLTLPETMALPIEHMHDYWLLLQPCARSSET